MDPFSSVATSINSCIRIFEVTYQLKAVDEQTADLLETTQHVITNINEARRLRAVKDPLINDYERLWIDSVVADTEKALRAVAQLIEPARVDKSTKFSINLSNKVMWVFRDNPKVRDKHARLTMCHQSLIAVITCLYGKDSANSAPILEEKKLEPPPLYDPQLEDLFNWRNSRRRWRSSTNVEQKTAGVSTSGPKTMDTASLRSLGDSTTSEEVFKPSANSYNTDSTLLDPRDPSTSLTSTAKSGPMPVTSDSISDTINGLAGYRNSSQDENSSIPAGFVSAPSLQRSTRFRATKRQSHPTNRGKLTTPDLPPSYTVSRPDYVGTFASEPASETFSSIFNNSFFGSSDNLPRIGDKKENSSESHVNDVIAKSYTAPNTSEALSNPLSLNNQPSTHTKIPDDYYDGADGLQVLAETPEPISDSNRSTYQGLESTLLTKDLPSPTVRSNCTEENASDDLSSLSSRSGYRSGLSVTDLGENLREYNDASERRDSHQPRRGGRSWLMFHASRSDVGQYGG